MGLKRSTKEGKRRGPLMFGVAVAGAALLGPANPARAAILHCDGSSRVTRRVASIAYDVWLPASQSAQGEGVACISLEGDADDETGVQSGIAALQRSLRQCEGQNLDVDGKFGARTAAAVKRVQRKYRLEADGKYGPQTARRMLWYGSRIGSPVCVRLEDAWSQHSEATIVAQRKSSPRSVTASTRVNSSLERATQTRRPVASRRAPSALVDFGPFRMTLTEATLVETFRENHDGGPLHHSVTFEANEDENFLTITLTGTNGPDDELTVTLSDGTSRWVSERGKAALVVGDETATLQLSDVKLRDEEGRLVLGPMVGHIYGPLSSQCMVARKDANGRVTWEEDPRWTSAPCKSAKR